MAGLEAGKKCVIFIWKYVFYPLCVLVLHDMAAMIKIRQFYRGHISVGVYAYV
jgi:hypothetical protein